jgi:hypothetical protein
MTRFSEDVFCASFMVGNAVFRHTMGTTLKVRNANEISGLVRVASDVEKWREMGQIGIFSPLLYQLSYPARTGKTHTHQNGVLESDRCRSKRDETQLAGKICYGTDMPRSRQIFRARNLLISECRGTADRRFDAGLPHHEWSLPSRIRTHPWAVRWRMSSRRFTALWLPPGNLPARRRGRRCD